MKSNYNKARQKMDTVDGQNYPPNHPDFCDYTIYIKNIKL